MVSQYLLQIFGAPSLLDPDGRPVPFRTKKQLALLVFLALEAQGRTVSRDVLIDLLWSDVSQERARHSLSQALTVIREKLGNDSVTRGGTAVRLTCALQTDLDSLPNGDGSLEDLAHPLRDFDQCGTAAFAHWVDGVRVRCRERARGHLLRQLNEARNRGDIGRVHERAARLYRVDPLCDSAVHALAERSLLEGDAVGAIRLLQSHRQRARKELGCNLGANLQRLLRRLEAGLVHVLDEQRVQTESTDRRTDVFVGREEELARLEALWANAQAGRLKTILVTGPAGIGKTSLIRRFSMSVAARAWPVFTVACQEIGRSIPFAAVSEFVYSLARYPAVSGTDPLWLAEASRVTPGLKAVYPGIPEPQPVPAESIRLRVAEAIVRMLDAVADEGSALVLFDNIQHMDPASRDVLHVLLRRVESAPVCVVATVRTTEHQRLRRDGEEGVSDLAWHARANLEPLDAAQAAEVIAQARAPTTDEDPGVRNKIVELAQGNPYLIEMLMSDWERDPDHSLVTSEIRGGDTLSSWHPPETMHKAFARQYNGLTSHAERLVNLLAVAGRKMPATEARSLLALKSSEMDRAAFELMERGTVRIEGTRLGFKNELHRAFVYCLMSDDSRKFYHSRIALALKAAKSVDNFQSQLEAAHHFARAHLHAEAVAAAQVGAELAITRGAPKEAEQALDDVIARCRGQCAPRIHLLHAKALLAQGQHPRALQVITNVVSTDLNAADAALGALLRAEALHRGCLADNKRVTQAARDAVTAATRANDEDCLINALQVSVEAARDLMDLDAVHEVGAKALRMGLDSGRPDTRALAQMTHGFCVMTSGKYGLAAGILSKASAALRTLSRDLELRRAVNGLGMCYTNLGDLRRAEELFREGIAIAERVGDDEGCGVVWSNLGVVYEDTGQFQKAAEAYRSALRHWRLAPTPRRSAQLLTNAADLAMLIGNFSEAADILEKAETEARRSNLLFTLVDVLVGCADLHIAQEQPELAWPFVERAIEAVGDRALLVGEIGRLERVKRHYLWVTQGYHAIQLLPSVAHSKNVSLRPAHKLEIQALEEKAAWLEGTLPVDKANAVREMTRLGLFGTLARVLALNTYTGVLPQRDPAESIAELVARLFPSLERQQIPQSVLGSRLADG